MLHTVQGTSVDPSEIIVLVLVSSKNTYKDGTRKAFCFCKNHKKATGGGVAGLLSRKRPYLPAIPTDGMGKQWMMAWVASTVFHKGEWSLVMKRSTVMENRLKLPPMLCVVRYKKDTLSLMCVCFCANEHLWFVWRVGVWWWSVWLFCVIRDMTISCCCIMHRECSTLGQVWCGRDAWQFHAMH